MLKQQEYICGETQLTVNMQVDTESSLRFESVSSVRCTSSSVVVQNLDAVAKYQRSVELGAPSDLSYFLFSLSEGSLKEKQSYLESIIT